MLFHNHLQSAIQAYKQNAMTPKKDMSATQETGHDNGGLTHFDSGGQAHMVDVGAKNDTHRVAIAKGIIRMKPATLAVKINDLNIAEICEMAIGESSKFLATLELGE